MYYTVYKIINLVNDKIYIGIHKTDNLDDGYYGSGLNIRRAITKYGSDNFRKEYLAIFDNPDDMYDTESELVNADFLNNDTTYNIIEGGNGGWSHINDRLDKITRHQIAVKAGKSVSSEKQSIKCPIEVRRELGRYMGKNFGGSNKLSDDDVMKRLSLIGNIDMTKFGWVSLVSDIWGVSHTQVRRFIDKYYSGSYYRRS